MQIKSAKDIWAALKVIHVGSVDQQNLIKHELLKQLIGFKMTNQEDVSSYHSRFQSLIDRMKAHKVNMEHLDESLAFIH